MAGVFTAAVLAAMPGLAAAENTNAALLAASCVVCHGEGGQSEGHIPAIDGLSAKAISQRLMEFRDGTRYATVMKKITMGYSEAQLKLIAGEVGKK